MNYYLKNAMTGEVGETTHDFFQPFVYVNYTFDDCFKNMTSSEITFMVYLATQISDEKLSVVCEVSDNIAHKTMINLSQINNKSFYRFLNKALQYKWLIKTADGTYKLNKNFVSRKEPSWTDTACRVMIKEYQSAYNNTTNGDRKILGYCVKLMPIMNENWNLLCNANSLLKTYPPEMQYSSHTEIGRHLGLTPKSATTIFNNMLDYQYRFLDVYNVTRFKRILHKIPLGDNKYTYMLTPYIFYKGSGFYRYAAMHEFY